MKTISALLGSFLTSAALAQQMPPEVPVTQFDKSECEEGFPVYYGIEYPAALAEIKKSRKPDDTAEAVFFGSQTDKIASSFSKLEQLQNDPHFLGGLKMAYIYTKSAKGYAISYMLDQQNKAICRIPQARFDKAKGFQGP
jgi:hypothetical protein